VTGLRGASLTARIVALDAQPLSVPLKEPFVIATGRMDATRAALVTLVLDDGAGRRARGLGEAAALPPVTREDQPDLLRAVAAARAYRDAGFACFKVKVGHDHRADHAALRAIAAAVPDARFRLDANEGYTARDALELLDRLVADGLALECFEQPCARDDLAGMAEVSAHSPVPVIADESFRGPADPDRLSDARAAHGVNLKLAKLGGPGAAVALGREARRRGLSLMAGAMVETRVGIATMAHVVAALGGVDWVDLDTAFLLARDPFVGGYRAEGSRLVLEPGAGSGVSMKGSSLA
jgi:L-alanine-DL-glutamate epimerase-like enolase superfamily enzyme